MPLATSASRSSNGVEAVGASSSACWSATWTLVRVSQPTLGPGRSGVAVSTTEVPVTTISVWGTWRSKESTQVPQ